MPTELLDVIATGGSGVALSSVLLYIYLNTVKRLDSQAERLEAQAKSHYDERVMTTEKLIDAVAGLSTHVDGLDTKIAEVTQLLQTGLMEMRTHYTEQRVKEAAKSD